MRLAYRDVSAYHGPMAERKKKTASLGCLFWIAIILLFIVLFFLKRNTIATVLENTGALDLLFGSKTTLVSQNDGKPSADAPVNRVTAPESTGTKPPVNTEPSATVGDGSAGDEPKTDAAKPSAPETAKPPTTESATPQTAPADTTKAPSAATAAEKPAAQTAPPAAATAEKPAPTRQATLFFVQIDSDGNVVRKQVTRDVPKTDSPMTEALKTLFAGPSAAEAKKGLRTLVPEGTKLLSATVKDGVASLNLSGEFQFNQFGIEGYIGQLAQVVFTATAFPTVNSVQFLIEGQRREYLGAEGVWIGTPLSRDKF